MITPVIEMRKSAIVRKGLELGATLDASLRVTRKGGQVVFYGMAGGDPAPVVLL